MVGVIAIYICTVQFTFPAFPAVLTCNAHATLDHFLLNSYNFSTLFTQTFVNFVKK